MTFAAFCTLDSRSLELRVVQREIAALMTEVRELQHEMHHDQRVAEAAARRRLLPRVRLKFPE